MKILVTGGAGYIGSHIVQCLGQVGHELIIVDDLSTGHASAVVHGDLLIADIGDQIAMDRLFAEHHFDACIHTSASISVPESVQRPAVYYRNNANKSIALIERCARAGVEYFIYSSTAAVYGSGLPGHGGRFDERDPTLPVNPYGRSKLVGEWALADIAAVSDMRYVVLRYFNVAGVDPDRTVGLRAGHASHLIKATAACALGQSGPLRVFGTDYPTDDGTCVRDYVHVHDLAHAHSAALAYLHGGGSSITLNCGSGQGHSVRDVISVMRRVSKVDFASEDAPRRAGDPPVLIARAERILRVLDWRPRFADLALISSSTLEWEKRTARSTRQVRAS